MVVTVIHLSDLRSKSVENGAAVLVVVCGADPSSLGAGDQLRTEGETADAYQSLTTSTFHKCGWNKLQQLFYIFQADLGAKENKYIEYALAYE